MSATEAEAAMRKSITAFNKDIKEFAQQTVPKQLMQFQKRVALEAFVRIVKRNPVGNPTLWKDPTAAPPGYVGGRSRANWQIRSTAADETVLEGTTEPSLAKGLSALADHKPYRTIHIFNNMPYILRLENGHSKQAPAGMVAVTLAEIRAMFKGST